MQPNSGYADAFQPTSAIDARARFITRTYNHLFGAIVAFAAIEIGLFQFGIAPVIAQAMIGTSWLLVLGAFMVVSGSRAASLTRPNRPRHSTWRSAATSLPRP